MEGCGRGHRRYGGDMDKDRIGYDGIPYSGQYGGIVGVIRCGIVGAIGAKTM